MQIVKTYPGNGGLAILTIKLSVEELEAIKQGGLKSAETWFGGSENDELPFMVQVRNDQDQPEETQSP